MMSAASKLKASYANLKNQVSQIYHLNSISSLLAWDEQVMMPHNEEASVARGLQNAALSGTIHDMWTGATLTHLLNELEQQKYEETEELNEFEKANVRLTKREFLKRTKIPKQLVEEQSKLQSEGYMVWVDARTTNNFAKFAPILARWLDVKKQVAECIDREKNVYDILLDEHERDLTSSRLDQIFVEFKQKLIPLIQKITQASKTSGIDSSMLHSGEGKFDLQKQEVVNRKIAEAIGFSFSHGRLDVSVHPFTVGVVPNDVRITTRYRKDEFVQGLAGTIHESGHAIYEQNLNPQYAYQPVSGALGMGLHESQSLLYERHVGLSKHFWKWAWPIVRQHFDHLNNTEFDVFEIYRAVNEVQPNLIRVESDEVTYPLHIVLRFEIEKDLLSGKLNISDLPRVWNEKMKEYLTIVPPSDKEGVLQDVHWSSGAFGYFPTYLIGQMCAAQLFNAACKAIPQLEQQFAQGQFGQLKKWLNENVHHYGSLLPIDDLLLKVTGEKINPNYLFNYLEQKYTEIYKL